MNANDSAWSGLELRHLLALVAVVEAGTSRGRGTAGLHAVGGEPTDRHFGADGGRAALRAPGGRRLVHLTVAGEMLLTHAQAVIARVSAAAADLRALASGEQGCFGSGHCRASARRSCPACLGPSVRSGPVCRSCSVSRENAPI